MNCVAFMCLRLTRDGDKVMSGPAFDIDEFCQRNHISRGTFYNLRKQGNGPRVMKVGGRTIITPEAEDDWRRNMEEKVAKPQSRPALRNLENAA
jgi:predicted DNA-binding transcriptional regulator AlpA